MNKFEQVFSLGHQMLVMVGEGSPQVTEFEQVSSLSHQLSVQVGEGESLYSEVLYPGGLTWGGGSLYGKVQCIVGNGHGILPPPNCEQADMTENITFPQLRWKAVIKHWYLLKETAC